MHVRPHNPMLDLAIGGTRRRHRSGPLQSTCPGTSGIQAWFAVAVPLEAWSMRDRMPTRLTWLVDGASVVRGIKMLPRIGLTTLRDVRTLLMFPSVPGGHAASVRDVSL